MRKFLCLAIIAVFSLVLLPHAGQAQGLAKRLILKDGSYQAVTKWEVRGERVRYYSAERSDWEELPKSLVDWDATEKYNAGRAAGEPPPESHELDKEDEAAAAAEEAAQPQIAPGLRLPDFEGVFILDSFQGHPEIVEVQQNGGEINRNMKGNIFRATINPLASAKQTIEIKGAHSTVQAHIVRPSIYIKVPADPDTDTKLHADKKQDQQSAASQPQSKEAPQGAEKPQQPIVDAGQRFRIVKLVSRKDSRVIGSLKIAVYGKVSQQQNVLAATAEQMPGGWVKISPKADLPPGEYAVAEMLSEKEMNLYVWDFGVNPAAPANPTAWKPTPEKAKPQNDAPVLNNRSQ